MKDIIIWGATGQCIVLYELLFRKLNGDKYNKKRWLFDMVSYDKETKKIHTSVTI